MCKMIKKMFLELKHFNFWFQLLAEPLWLEEGLNPYKWKPNCGFSKGMT